MVKIRMQREYREIQMFKIGPSTGNPPNTSGIQNGSDFNDIWDVIDDYYKLHQYDDTKGKMRIQVIQHQECEPYFGPVDLSGNVTYFDPKDKSDASGYIDFGGVDTVAGVDLIPRNFNNYTPVKNGSGEFEIPLALNGNNNVNHDFDPDVDDTHFGHLLASDGYDGSGNPLLDVSGSESQSPKTTTFTIIFWRNSDDVYVGSTEDPNYYNVNASGGYYDAVFNATSDEIGRIEIEINVENTGTGTLYTEINSTATLAKEEKITIISTIDGNGRDYWREVAWSCGNPLFNEDGSGTTDVNGSIRRSELANDANFNKFFFNISSEDVCDVTITNQDGVDRKFDSLYTYGQYIVNKQTGQGSTFWGTDEGNIEIKEIRVTINPDGRINWMPSNCIFTFSHVDTPTSSAVWSNHDETETGLIWTAGGVEGESEENEIRNGTQWKFELSIHGKDIELSNENKVNLFNQPNGNLIVPIAIEFDVYDYALVSLDDMNAVADDNPGDASGSQAAESNTRGPGPQREVVSRNLPQVSSFATTTFTTVRLVPDDEPEPEPVDHFTFSNGFILGVLAVLLLRLLIYVLRSRYLKRSR